MTDTRKPLWRSPAGRIHLRQRCSGNGRPKDTVKVLLTEAQFAAYRDTGNVCRCAERVTWQDSDPAMGQAR